MQIPFKFYLFVNIRDNLFMVYFSAMSRSFAELFKESMHSCWPLYIRASLTTIMETSTFSLFPTNLWQLSPTLVFRKVISSPVAKNLCLHL